MVISQNLRQIIFTNILRPATLSNMPGKKEVDAPDPQIYGFNPISHHYVKRSGPVWLRLVKAGMAEDPELVRNLQEKALARKKAGEEKAEAKAEASCRSGPSRGIAKPSEAKSSNPPGRDPSGRTAKALRAARKLVASNRSELDDLESDAVDEKLSKVMAKRLALADTTTDVPSSSDSDSEPEPVSRKPRRPRPSEQPGPMTSRIRLKSQPIPIPSSDRRAALKQTLSMPLDSDED